MISGGSVPTTCSSFCLVWAITVGTHRSSESIDGVQQKSAPRSICSESSLYEPKLPWESKAEKGLSLTRPDFKTDFPSVTNRVKLDFINYSGIFSWQL